MTPPQQFFGRYVPVLVILLVFLSTSFQPIMEVGVYCAVLSFLGVRHLIFCLQFVSPCRIMLLQDGTELLSCVDLSPPRY